MGGLLAVHDSSTISSQPSTHFVGLDGNGNVTGLVKASDGTIQASYEYGPLGETIRGNGPMAAANPFRLSTEYQDNESDLTYYGAGYYSASAGRLLGRDALGESLGENIYSVARQDPKFVAMYPQYSTSMNPQYNTWAQMPSGIWLPEPWANQPVIPNPPAKPTGPRIGMPSTRVDPPSKAGSNPRSPPKGGSRDSSAGGQAWLLAKVVDVSSAVLEQADLNRHNNEGMKSCLAKAKRTGCGGCCKISLYLIEGLYDSNRQLFSAGSKFYEMSCSDLKVQEAASASGESMQPEFRRFDGKGPLDKQSYRPQHEEIRSWDVR